MRITQKDLQKGLERLNSYTKGQYRLEGAYGGWQLVREIEDGTGAITNISNGFKSNREVYDLIHAICRLLEYERSSTN